MKFEDARIFLDSFFGSTMGLGPHFWYEIGLPSYRDFFKNPDVMVKSYQQFQVLLGFLMVSPSSC